MANKPFIQIMGMEQIRKRAKKWDKEIREAAKEALYDEALLTLEESNTDVPVDTGNLRASGYVKRPNRLGNVHIGYAAGYATYVHENLEAYHPVGKAKFLEDVIKKRRKGFMGRIRYSIKRKTGRKL